MRPSSCSSRNITVVVMHRSRPLPSRQAAAAEQKESFGTHARVVGDRAPMKRTALFALLATTAIGCSDAATKPASDVCPDANLCSDAASAPDSASSMQCTNTASCNGGDSLQVCVESGAGGCVSMTYRVGTQSFECASCTDCAEANAAATASCQGTTATDDAGAAGYDSGSSGSSWKCLTSTTGCSCTNSPSAWPDTACATWSCCVQYANGAYCSCLDYDGTTCGAWAGNAGGTIVATCPP